MTSDPAVKPSLRVGMAAAVQLELNGPPRDSQAFRKAITDSLNAKLQANGMTPGPGSSASFIVHVEAKDTGRKYVHSSRCFRLSALASRSFEALRWLCLLASPTRAR
jgi:hypothetical protein